VGHKKNLDQLLTANLRRSKLLASMRYSQSRCSSNNQFINHIGLKGQGYTKKNTVTGDSSEFYASKSQLGLGLEGSKQVTYEYLPQRKDTDEKPYLHSYGYFQ
jgi:hypothetical protein